MGDRGCIIESVENMPADLICVDVHIEQLVLVHDISKGVEKHSERHQQRGYPTVGHYHHQHHHQLKVGTDIDTKVSE